MPTRVIIGGVGADPGRDDGRAARVLHGAPRRHPPAADVRAARPRRDERRDPAAPDPRRRRLGRALHRGLRLPADVRPRHDRRGDGAGRDRAWWRSPSRSRRSASTRPPGWSSPTCRWPTARRPSVTIRNVPALRGRARSRGRGARPRHGRRYDLAFGGNFYAILRLEQVGLPFDRAAKKRDPRRRPGDHGGDQRSRRAGSPRGSDDPRLPPRALPRARLRRPALTPRDGDPPRLVRPLAVRHRHLRPDGPAARPRRARA